MEKNTTTEKESASEETKPLSLEYLRLSVPLVYEQIIDYIDFPGLYQCRMVSKAWKEVADKFLRRKLDLHTISAAELELVSTLKLIQLRCVFKDMKDSAERVLMKRPISFEVLPLPQPIKEWQSSVLTDLRNHLLAKCIVCPKTGFSSLTGYLQGIDSDDADTILEAHKNAVTAQKLELDMIEKADTRVSLYSTMQIQYFSNYSFSL